jgi:hypothetical protein
VGVLKGLSAAGLIVAGVLALPSAASASQTIGQVGDVSTGSCTDDEAYLQKVTTTGAAYLPGAYGVITSWSAMSKAGAGQTVRLMVFRDDGSNQFSAVARDSVVRTLSSVDDTLNTFTGTRIPIEATQRIGIYQPAGSTEGCEFAGVGADAAGFSVPFNVGEPPLNTPFDYSGTDTPNRVNASAVVEPDFDRDRFGDETQDKCLVNPGPVDGCPSQTPPSQTPKKKKCKKKHKRHQASAAKKRCKHKKR